MTREQIIQMARDAGAYDGYNERVLEAFASAIRAATKEEDARICEKEVEIRTKAGEKHPEDSESRGRCFAGARAAINCALEIRASK